MTPAGRSGSWRVGRAYTRRGTPPRSYGADRRERSAIGSPALGSRLSAGSRRGVGCGNPPALRLTLLSLAHSLTLRTFALARSRSLPLPSRSHVRSLCLGRALSVTHAKSSRRCCCSDVPNDTGTRGYHERGIRRRRVVHVGGGGGDDVSDRHQRERGRERESSPRRLVVSLSSPSSSNYRSVSVRITAAAAAAAAVPAVGGGDCWLLLHERPHLSSGATPCDTRRARPARSFYEASRGAVNPVRPNQIGEAPRHGTHGQHSVLSRLAACLSPAP